MEAFVVLLLIYLFLALVVFPIWAMAKISNLAEQLERDDSRFEALTRDILKLRAAVYTPSPAAAAPETPPAPAQAAAPVVVPAPAPVSEPVPLPIAPEPIVPLEIKPAVLAETLPVITEAAAVAPAVEAATPPPLVPETPLAAAQPEPAAQPAPTRPAYTPPPPPEPGWMDSINWEQFMGAKLFAWLGGFALFLGVTFFIKYSFDHGWIPPAVRAALGFMFGAGLIVGGLRIPRARYDITAKTLIATGIVSLYGVTFACNSIYHFAWFGVGPSFLLMSLITATAFVLAVRLEAQVVAILGILGGFLTPKLLSTGVDNPVGLFGYLALLNVGLIAVSLNRRWFYLVPLGAAGTVLTMVAWAGLFFGPEKVGTAMTVCLGFSALFIGAVEAGRRWDRSSPLLAQTAIVLPMVALGFAWYFLGYPAIAARTGLFFGYVFLASLGIFFLAWREDLGALVAGMAGATALLIIRWVDQVFTGTQSPAAMAVCLVFCAVYFAIYFFSRRNERATPAVFWPAVGLPGLALGVACYLLGYPAAAERTVLFFGFVVVVSLFVFALAWLEGMGRLVAGVAGVTAVLLARWAAVTFKPELAPVIMTVCLVFCAIYFALYLLARRLERASTPVLFSALGLPFVALAFALFLMNHPAVGAQPGLLFSFILACDALLLALAWIDERVPRLHLVAGLAVFGLLSVWTANHLTNALLPWALAMYLAFAALHTVFPLLLERKRPASAPTWWSQLFPPLTLLLMLLPIFRLESVSFLLWPAILVVDLMAIALAALSASLAAVGAVLVLTLLATGMCLFRVPVTMGLDLPLLLVIGGFAVFFFAACLWLGRRLAGELPAADKKLAGIFGDPRAQLPAFASLLPFLLLLMACARLTIPDPSAVFGLGLLLVVLTLGLARLMIGRPFDKLRAFDSGGNGPAMSAGRQAGVEWLSACALAGIAALELVWHARHFTAADAGVPLVWYVAFSAIFAAYPFLFRRAFSRLTGPWTVAALSGPVHFFMVYRAIKLGWPGSANFLGAVPALFAVAPLGSLVAALRTEPEDNPARLSRLAWFGGVALFFITLVFPIQFENQWLTVAWALEGAALLWLFHRVPHPGLRVTGVALLLIAFVRLGLNPAVFGYHLRGPVGIFNWYLYAYGLATAALFTGARLLAPPRERVLGFNVPPLLNTLAVILAFLLLNIEIADYFTAPGARSLAFKFSGNFARDMSYTIGWALFALALLGGGIWQKTRVTRYAAISLLSVALLKLFLHDLARLEAFYRIGALFAVAVIAILASLAYQRFLPTHEEPAPSTP